MRFRSTRRVTPEITLTPLIDILFIVLIFLVLTTSFNEVTGIRLALPESDTGQAVAAAADTYRVTVAADGAIRLRGGEPITVDDLEAGLRSVPDKPAAQVILAADVAAPHGRVVQVMDHVRRAGIFRLDIQTLPPPRP